MIKSLKSFVMAVALMLATVVPTTALASPVTSFGAKCPSRAVLNFPAWSDGLECESGVPVLGKLNDIWVIVLNVIRMLIALVSYFALGYVIWGGFKYIKSQGQPNAIGEAKMAIIQAVAGFVIALASFAIVRFVQGLIV